MNRSPTEVSKTRNVVTLSNNCSGSDGIYISTVLMYIRSYVRACICTYIRTYVSDVRSLFVQLSFVSTHVVNLACVMSFSPSGPPTLKESSLATVEER